MGHRILYTIAAAIWFVMMGMVPVTEAKSSKPNKYASIIIDSDSLEILHARKIDGARYPASLTKMMTLYLTFDALNRGDVKLNDQMLVSTNAARTPPVKLGLKAGKTITVNQAIQALAVRSANDAAVVLAEHLSGSEAEFAKRMTLKAKAIGMRSTVFQNPHGLPDPGQISTARDMAKLAHSLLRNHSRFYPYFSQKTFHYNGQTYTNHNALLGTVDGVDGFKTGYTRASGYNLVLSAKRDGRRIIAVVMGGASGKSRNKHMADLIERGYDVLEKNQSLIRQSNRIDNPVNLNADLLPRPTVRKHEKPIERIKAYSLRAASGHKTDTVRIVHGRTDIAIPKALNLNAWSIQIGTYQSEFHAHQANAYILHDPELNIGPATPQIIPVQRDRGPLFRARLAGISHKRASAACKTLASRGHSCLVISPS
ncbi:MAG: D-alanyl-D-alanine carboxypeptidase [Hyphomonadaceae bacterium]|nr:D-alanyl-D-alanine carboxypeptidase [Hyphomonadaceae bacterium]